MPKAKEDILLLVDGNALIHRGFHAIPHLSTKKGEPVNGVYGFALLFLKALKELAPKYVAVAFDLPGATFRDKLFAEYKAQRVRAPDELYQQIPRVKELVKAFNIPTYEIEGYEADDLIGSLVDKAKQQNLKVIILTGDLDTLQLVGEQVKVFAPKQGISETKLYDEEAIKERYGLEPSQLIDYKALRGDPSDNIPGVKGIGEKTASELLQKFGSLEKIYEYLTLTPALSPRGREGEGEIKPRTAKLLLEHKEDAFLSKKLVTLVKDLKIKFDPEDAALANYDEGKVFKIFQELEFKSLLDKLPKSSRTLPSPLPSREGNQIGISSPLAGEDKGEGGYQLVDTPEKYWNFLAELQKQKTFALDTETTSLKPVEADLLGIGFCWEEGRAHYVPASRISEIASSPSALGGRIPRNDNLLSKSLRASAKQSLDLKQILENPALTLIGHNIKYDYLVLKRAGINLQAPFFDTMIAAYLLNPGARNFDLDTLAFTEFGFRKIPISSLIGAGKNEINMSEVPVEKVAAYCGEDADYTWRLREKLEKEIWKQKLEKIFFEIEMPLIAVLAEMENWGVKVDPKVLKRLSAEAAKEVEKLQSRIYRLAGQEFNIGSPLQLKEVLFEKLGIPSEELKKGKTGLSTAATELEKLRGLHPIVELIFEWRELTKLKNTYLDALPELINSTTGRVHTSYNQTIAATGRLSSSDPNLQNIPIRTDFGRKIRQAFIAQKGFKLVSIDYSQIELRLAAHLSQDEKMIRVFREGGDIHEATAREIFGLPPHPTSPTRGEENSKKIPLPSWEGQREGEVTPDQRRAAKTINFGVLYGLSAYGLKSRIPGVSQGQAQDFIDKYFETYPRLTKYLEEVVAETRRKGYVKNEIGRVRFLPEINSSQWQVRAAAERAAINMPFQSMNADIIKTAMNKLRKENLTNQDDCRLLLQVHDELVFEIRESKVQDYVPQAAQIMSQIYKLKVPLVVEAKVGASWGEMHVYG